MAAEGVEARLEALRRDSIEDRLEKLAHRLRAEGVTYGPERDLMVDAANLLREYRRGEGDES